MPDPGSDLRNVRAYPVYAGLVNAFFWMPVFFLFFGRHLPLADVLRLEAVYYVAVVILEVPSGYFSDRVGRRPTLLVSAGALTAAYAIFTAGSSFPVFAVAQVLLAAGIAFNSGTDVSFHYDSLCGAGREREFAEREARVARIAFLSSAVAALLGGAVATVSLRLAYALSTSAAVAGLIVLLRCREPTVREHPTLPGAGFLGQLRACGGYLRSGMLAWLFAISVAMVVLNHVPYEFYQPYVRLLGVGGSAGLDATPFVTGALAAAMGVIASGVAGRSTRLAGRFGFRRTMLAGMALQTILIGVMGMLLHPLILLLVILRGVPRALMTAPMNSVIAPAVDRAHRATYLSLQSLAGRLAFSGFLALLSLIGDGAAPATWPVLSRLLLVSAGVGAAALVAAALAARQAAPAAAPGDG